MYKWEEGRVRISWREMDLVCGFVMAAAKKMGQYIEAIWNEITHARDPLQRNGTDGYTGKVFKLDKLHRPLFIRRLLFFKTYA